MSSAEKRGSSKDCDTTYTLHITPHSNTSVIGRVRDAYLGGVRLPVQVTNNVSSNMQSMSIIISIVIANTRYSENWNQEQIFFQQQKSESACFSEKDWSEGWRTHLQWTSAPPSSSGVTTSPVAAFTKGGPPRKMVPLPVRTSRRGD
jgi:hypothetical protein